MVLKFSFWFTSLLLATLQLYNTIVAGVTIDMKGLNKTDATNSDLTLKTYYVAKNAGRGIWKWDHYLSAYDKHITPLAGYSFFLAEVGVQSGGSIDMWEAVLPKCHVFGLDINPQVKHFAGPRTTIEIGDQGDDAFWTNFYTQTVPSVDPTAGRRLDVLIDDGSHLAPHMLTTLIAGFNNVGNNGLVAIEDIHGDHYVNDFFTPAATFLAQQASATPSLLDSVHMYPYVLLAQKSGTAYPSANTDIPRPVLFNDPNAVVVSSFDELWQQVPNNRGKYIVLYNPSWGSFHTAQGMTNFFTYFKAFHSSSWYDVPTGCQHQESVPSCTNIVNLNDVQTKITGIHIYADRLICDIAPVSPPVSIIADRRGTEWLPY